MAPPPVLLPGESHGRGSLAGCSPWGREESDMTERLPFHFHALAYNSWSRNDYILVVATILVVSTINERTSPIGG